MTPVVNVNFGTNTTAENVAAKAKEREKLFNLTVQNINRTGKKAHCYIPTELLYVDERYQRESESSKAKINNLARKWDDNKMDDLKVSIHPEEKRFSVVNGMHRLGAAEILGIDTLNCEVLYLSDDPKERLKEEARIFSTQTDEVDPLTPVEKHKSNCLRKVRENIILQEILDKHNIPLKSNRSHGRVKIGHLAGFTAALRIAKRENGKESLENIFDVIVGARWNIASKGMGALVITSIDALFKLHPEYIKVIKDNLIEFCKPIEPEKFFASAMDKYPERTETERLIMYLEDKVCETCGIEKVYFGGRVA